MTGVVIAIDGPSGVGKSTVSREVARRLGLAYFDTGATYRATALACLREGVDLANEPDVVAMAETMNVELILDPSNPLVLLDGEEVSRLLRSEEVTSAVSAVATNLEARAALGRWQRDVIAREIEGGFSGGAGIVAEGRDITTVIASDAEVRVLMTADPEVRVARRAAESGHESGVHGLNVQETEAQIRAGVLGRDAKDSTVVNFTTAADGVVTLDTTDLTIDEAVDAVIALVRGARE
jgi:cytidylate kinase